jgi:hypothetical protein
VLRKSEERFLSVTALSSTFYWETDASHCFTVHRLGAESSSVFPTGAQIGKTRWDLAYQSPDLAGWRVHKDKLDVHEPFPDFSFRA